MSWPSNDNRCVVLAACTLALVASCWMTACDASDRQLASQAAQAEQEVDEKGEAVSSSAVHAPTAQDVLDYVSSDDFRVFGVELGSHPTDGSGLQVQMDDRSICVYEDAVDATDGVEASQIEERLCQALESRFRNPQGNDEGARHGWTTIRNEFKAGACNIVRSRLAEVKACTLALHMRMAELKIAANPRQAEEETGASLDGQATGVRAQGEDRQSEQRLAFDATGAGETGVSEMSRTDARKRDIHVPRTPASVCVHWVTGTTSCAGASGDDPADDSAKRQGGRRGVDQNEGPQSTEAPGAVQGEGANDAGRPNDDVAGTGDLGSGGAPADGAGNSGSPATPRPAAPSKPGSIDVVEAPGSSDANTVSPAPSSPAAPTTPQPTWVVDVPAWDEHVVTNPAWDEQVWVSKQEWVPNNVWIVDAQAWDEQVLVSEGYYETVRTTSHYRFAADGFVAYTDDEVMAHVKYLMAQGSASNYYVEWEHEQVWHEPEYSWVHHDEVGHWEDQGSYRDNGHYETVHHEAQYTWVHHDEVGHWE